MKYINMKATNMKTINMKSIHRLLTILVVGSSLGAAVASAQGINTMGGNPVVPRSQRDGFASYLLDSHHPFTQTGALKNWEIYAYDTQPVQLVIYRQSNGAFVEVGRSPAVTPVLGYNLFRLDKPIVVQAGDFIGALNGTVGVAGGSIAYSLDGTETDSQCVVNLERTTLLALDPSTNFVCSSNRTYSLRAFAGNN
jgi:hypothetical protein